MPNSLTNESSAFAFQVIASNFTDAALGSPPVTIELSIQTFLTGASIPLSLIAILCLLNSRDGRGGQLGKRKIHMYFILALLAFQLLDFILNWWFVAIRDTEVQKAEGSYLQTANLSTFDPDVWYQATLPRGHVNWGVENSFSIVIFQICVWLADGYVLYRTYLVWREMPWVLVLPSIFYLGTIVMGIMTSIPSFSKIHLILNVAVLACSALVDVIGTGLIISNFIRKRRNILDTQIPNAASFGRTYEHLITIFCESLVLYTVPKLFCSIWTVLSVVKFEGSWSWVPALPGGLLPPLTSIAPCVLIIRAAWGVDASPFYIKQAAKTTKESKSDTESEWPPSQSESGTMKIGIQKEEDYESDI